MKRVLRIAAIAVGSSIALLAISVGVMMVLSGRREAARYAIDCPSVTVPSDPAAIAEGKRLYISRGCGDCHGEDGGGKVVIDDAPGVFAGTNLTATAARYSDQDFVRAIRHGVGSDGRPLLFMPSVELWGMNDRDVGMIISYVRSLPPVGTELPTSELRPLGRVLHVLGAFPAIAAEKIDHDAPRPVEVPIGATEEYGGYLAMGCTGCHGEHYSGGAIPGAPPELGVPPNLTPHASGLVDWTLDDFRRAMRDGLSKDGRQMNPRQMPYPLLALLTDVEIEALYLYLRTVPARPFGQR